MSLDAQGLYHPSHEHDACGVGFVAHIKGKKSHGIVEQGLTVLRNLTHRGAVGWDPKLSDGAGLLIQIPDKFLREVMAKQGLKLPPAGQYGVGMVFLPRDPASRFACEYEIERAIKDEGQVLLGWRDVPVDNGDLAEPAKRIEPVIRQVFIGRGKGVTVTDALERKLYIIRKSSGHAIQALRLAHGKEFYVPSMSARTACYKGMLLAHQGGQYYKDRQDAPVESALALVHQRFSTNTFPSWDLAHPFRMICHNGEINTLRGNVNWIRARQGAISSPVLGRDLEKIWPLIYDGQSDSASFDNALELLVMGGYSVAHAMMMMIPEAWENHTLMDPTRRAFYEYHAAMMEPWDGRAAKGPAAERVGREAGPPAGLRLHAGAHQVHHDPDGDERRGTRRLDGQRLAACGAVGQEQDAEPLLQSALRPGHEPPDRPDPRGAGDVSGVFHRTEAEPARHRRDEPASPARSVAAGARFLRHGENPAHRALHRREVPLARAGHHLPHRVGQGGGRGAPRVALRAGRGCGARGLLDHRDFRPARGAGARGHSGASGIVGNPPAPRGEGSSHERGSRGGNGLRA